MEFREITLADKAVFDEYYIKYPQSSAFLSFTTLYLWKGFSGIKYAVLPDGNIVLGGVSGRSGARYFSLPETNDEVLLSVVKQIKTEFGEFLLVNLTEEQTEVIKKAYPDCGVKYKRNNNNYVYETKSLAELSGKKLQSKRNHLNRFKNTYTYELVDIDNSEMAEECIEMTRLWYEEKEDADSYLEAEIFACRESLTHMKELGLTGMAIRVDGKIAAYSIGEYMNGGRMAHIIIEKALNEYSGAYNAINNFFIIRHWSDTEYVNREEDMGLEGLRKAKTSYRPAFLIKMYDVSI